MKKCSGLRTETAPVQCWFCLIDQVQFRIQPETEPGLFRQRSSFSHLGLREQNQPCVCSVERGSAGSQPPTIDLHTFHCPIKTFKDINGFRTFT